MKKKIFSLIVIIVLIISNLSVVFADNPLDRTGSINFIKQGKSTCKATSLAMALNLITGKNSYTTASLGNNSCTNIGGNSYKDGYGNTFKATYKRDNYVGSYSEETNAINASLSAGLPAVAAVHSTKSGKTKHHWVLIVGKSGNDYLVVDPAKSGSGKISNNIRTMSGLSYDWGLTDYSSTHYGYITFTKTSRGSSSSYQSQTNNKSNNNSGSYFAKCSSSCSTITKGLNNIGANSSYSYRAKIAVANNISNYKGTAAQNNQMLSLLKQGRLIKPGATVSQSSTKSSNSNTKSYFAKCSSSCSTITKGLNNIGANSSYSYRAKIAVANNISNYKGTAAQNTYMLSLLKQGILIKP